MSQDPLRVLAQPNSCTYLQGMLGVRVCFGLHVVMFGALCQAVEVTQTSIGPCGCVQACLCLFTVARHNFELCVQKEVVFCSHSILANTQHLVLMRKISLLREKLKKALRIGRRTMFIANDMMEFRMKRLVGAIQTIQTASTSVRMLAAAQLALVSHSSTI